MQKSRRNPALSVLGGPPVPPSRGPLTGALTEFDFFSTDSARYRSNGRETRVARQPQWVEKAAVRSPPKTILVLAHPFLEPSIGERLQPKGMEPLRLTCGASSDPVGRRSSRRSLPLIGVELGLYCTRGPGAAGPSPRHEYMPFCLNILKDY